MYCPYLLMPLVSLAALRAQDLADVFARVSPSVVTIRAEVARLTETTAPQLEIDTRIGSGVLLNNDGAVLTAFHVVNMANELEVQFADGSRRNAEVSAVEPGADLALLEVQGELPDLAEACVLGDSDATKVGNRVFVIGAPRGMERTLTAGYVSAKRREERFLGSMQFVEHFQTDAAINPGNSGGPMFNLRGEVIGIACHIVTSSAGSEGLGFAVTSNAAKRMFLDEPRVWFGFDAELLPEPLALALNVPEGRSGLLVTSVAGSSAAYRAGLRAGTIPARILGRALPLGGDIVVAIEDHPFASENETEAAVAVLRGAEPGSVIRLSILRAGRVIELSVTPGR